MADFKDIPSVTKLLKDLGILKLISTYGDSVVKAAIRSQLDTIRQTVKDGGEIIAYDELVKLVTIQTSAMCGDSFKGVINSTGIILHTNLGRAPLGTKMIDAITPLMSGYSNLEFDLTAGRRGSRYDHIRESLKHITSAEDVLVVNNNASAVILALSAFCKGGEVIISRGELIEIGGSFRLPEIFEFAGCKLVEVGATNKTKPADYEKAITENTRAILKVHKSNFAQIGFTVEASIPELSDICKRHKIPLFYDQGSGLLRKPANLPLEDEPDVHSSLKQGADLVMFSCDKLLGGPQGGVLAGKKELIKTLSKTPLLRAIRMSKLDLAALSWVCHQYMQDETLKANIPIFSLMDKSQDTLKSDAELLASKLTKIGYDCEVVTSSGQVGGGTLPHVKLDSYAVALKPEGSAKEKKRFAEKLHEKLRHIEIPIIAILREGEILFDVLTLFEGQIDIIVEALRIEKA